MIRLIEEFQSAMVNGILKRWYPLVLDKECGGYYTNVSSDWTLPPEQEKMVVSQSRHIWTLAKVSAFINSNNDYRSMARQGFLFLKIKCGITNLAGSTRYAAERAVFRTSMDGEMKSALTEMHLQFMHLRHCTS